MKKSAANNLIKAILKVRSKRKLPNQDGYLWPLLVAVSKKEAVKKPARMAKSER